MNAQPADTAIAALGHAAAQLRIETLPEEVARRARQRVVDTLACLVAGYEAGIAGAVRHYVLAQGGAPEATLLPGGQRTTVALACLAHATYIHGLELSDAAPRATAHPGNEIVPTALALAEREGLTGRTVLPAVAAGYEVEIRIGRALFPSAFYRGWWLPGFLGPIGAAVTAAHLLGLDGPGIADALGIALNLLPTAMARATRKGIGAKWLVGGHAAATGVLAAEMAARGTDGMREIVADWLPVITDDVHPDRLTEGLAADGTFAQWELLSGVLTKYYATVGPLAASLDATFELVEAHDVRATDVTAIEVDCPKRTALFNAVHPENETAARASLPYCVAVAVLTRDRGRLLGPAFTPAALADPDVAALAEKVRISENADYERQYPARSLAQVTLRLRDGRAHSLEVDRSARTRYLEPTDDDIAEKFRLVAAPVLGPERGERALNLAWRLEEEADLRPLIDALRVEA